MQFYADIINEEAIDKLQALVPQGSWLVYLLDIACLIGTYTT